MNTVWERLDDHTERLKVPGGWLVRSANEVAVHQAFVPDATHRWQLESEAKQKVTSIRRN